MITPLPAFPVCVCGDVSCLFVCFYYPFFCISIGIVWRVSAHLLLCLGMSVSVHLFFFFSIFHSSILLVLLLSRFSPPHSFLPSAPRRHEACKNVTGKQGGVHCLSMLIRLLALRFCPFLSNDCVAPCSGRLLCCGRFSVVSFNLLGFSILIYVKIQDAMHVILG